MFFNVFFKVSMNTELEIDFHFSQILIVCLGKI